MPILPRPSARRALLLAAVAATAVATAPAHAQIDCWIDAEHPRTADNLAVADARVAALRRTMHEVNALLHRQSELHALPRTRLRSSWQLGGQWQEPARPAGFLLRDHRESVWTPGGCGVIAGADRLEPKAGVVVRVNVPHAFFDTAAPELKDEQLQAWREVPATGAVRGHTLYGGHMLVFTASGRLPWVPVTTEEYLDFTERDLGRQLQDARRSRAEAQRAAQPAEQEAMLERVAEGLRKVDPAQAEKMIAEIRANNARANAAAAARGRPPGGPEGELPQEAMLRKLRAWRAGLSPQALNAQARLGLNGLQPADVPAERFALLAKPDPAFAWDRQAPLKAQMIMVSVRGNGEFEAGMRAVLQGLDVEGFERLVRAR
ncbi:MAG TPA: hypothetical protein VLJ58_19965 [Ramlibacter sp.]|nr:hypothetical protein [Ramlibacter sp.]